MKRGMDILGASVGLVGLGPVFAGTALTIWLSMGRPVFFTQERPGFRERPFRIIKFRTMRHAARDETWFRTDGERLTWLGRFLRRSSIDELPELINVLRGEMSLVGPRPLLMDYLWKYTPHERRRHNVPPGITGWAQVNGRQAITFSQRLRHDVWYVDNWSIKLDLRILWMTLRQVARGRDVIPGQQVDEVDDIGLSADRQRAIFGEGGA